MDQVTLIEKAKAGDVDAFTELVQRYGAMAFGYAYANLGDFHLAEDIVQQAFVVAYNNLSRLEHPGRFGGWLRGIVRFECLHLLRTRRAVQIPIETVSGIASASPGPAEIAEEQEGFDRILAAINGLPRAEREATILYYIHDHSQRDVAEFLNLPVTSVNNRLRSARKRLKQERVLAMTKDAFREHSLPEDFATRIGEVVRVQGHIVEARFPADHRPSVLSTLTISDGTGGPPVTADVAQHLGNDMVRCIITSPVPSNTLPDSGLQVVGSEEAASAPIEPAFIRQVIASLRRPTATTHALETGIKAIDVLTPLPTGGLVGLVGDGHTGKMVLVEELVHRLGQASDVVSILVFVETPNEVAALRKLEYRTSAAVEAVYLPVTDASAAALSEVTSDLDAVISLSRHLADDGIYPAIDPLQSTSRLLEPGIVGREHCQVAPQIRQLLEQAGNHAGDGRSRAESSMSRRASQIQQFLTQPFFVAEPYTNRPGRSVPRDAALKDCKALLEGEHDDVDKDALYMTGTLDDAITGS